MDIELELFDGVTTDTLTGKITQQSVYMKSGNRSIFIAVNTLVKINDFLKSKGIRVNSND